MTFKIKDLIIWSLRLSVRTAGFHPAKGGSIPPGTAKIFMYYYTYMLKSITPGTKKTYVGYTNNILLRLKRHNSNKGAILTTIYILLLI